MTNIFDSVNAALIEPSEIIAGDFVQWKRTDLGDYINSAYTLKYSARLGGSGASEIEITATADGSDYLVSVPATTTALYAAGTYYWQMYITRDSDSERITFDNGTWLIKPGLDASTDDPRSHARIMVSKIESLLENRADSDVGNYSIGSRSITKMTAKELREWWSFYRQQVAAEDAAVARTKGRPTGNTVLVRFL
jgi:hypothetical protein